MMQKTCIGMSSHCIIVIERDEQNNNYEKKVVVHCIRLYQLRSNQQNDSHSAETSLSDYVVCNRERELWTQPWSSEWTWLLPGIYKVEYGTKALSYQDTHLRGSYTLCTIGGSTLCCVISYILTATLSWMLASNTWVNNSWLYAWILAS